MLIGGVMMVKVKSGIDNIDKYLNIFDGKRVGLITNPTGVNSEFKSTVDVMKEKTNLVALYGPEHGIRGDIQAGQKVGNYIDEKTGIQVYSLYGKNKSRLKRYSPASMFLRMIYRMLEQGSTRIFIPWHMQCRVLQSLERHLLFLTDLTQ